MQQRTAHTSQLLTSHLFSTLLTSSHFFWAPKKCNIVCGNKIGNSAGSQPQSNSKKDYEPVFIICQGADSHAKEQASRRKRSSALVSATVSSAGEKNAKGDGNGLELYI